MTEVLLSTVPGYRVADKQLIFDIHKILNHHFPGYTWIVGLNEEELGGIVCILNVEVNEQILGCPNWGYTLKISTVYNDSSRKCIIDAGGAILESAGISTNKNKDEEIKNIDGIDHKRYPLIGII